ncbi:hypothetical protein CWN50_14880 [Klebsiella michiganensis]|uniref:Uncharacterized protein n=1 Tax=Klebsiella michiganensis TaxID=1134687 RepID=A0A2J4R631_9ENTR|nr:hypothetical protein CWN50_14880 [Klebsiella michiganensis]
MWHYSTREIETVGEDNSLKSEGCINGRKAVNSAYDKPAVFYGCFLVEIGNGADRKKKKGRISDSTLWLVSNAGIIALAYSDSLAFLRCRRLISPLIEATTKPAVLSPSSFTFSSSPINSKGTLETICCDLLFLEPVAMSMFPFDWWHSVYAKRKHNQHLKVAFTLFYGECMPPIEVMHKWQRPGVREHYRGV